MKRSKIMISHGRITHSLEEAKNCKFCQEVEREFNEAMRSGEVDRVLASLDKEFGETKKQANVA